MEKPKLYSEKVFFMKIKDKIKLNEKLFCPPHYWPHKFPKKPLIKNERCHFHKAKFRMLHHNPFCIYLKCPHYKKMRQEYKNWKLKTKNPR